MTIKAILSPPVLTGVFCSNYNTDVIRMNGEMVVKDHVILTFAVDRGKWSGSRSGRSIPRKEPNMRVSVPKALWTKWRKEKSPSLPEIEPWLSSP
jgi:hypothetical protein